MIAKSRHRRRLIAAFLSATAAVPVADVVLLAQQTASPPQKQQHIVIFRFQRQTFQQDAAPEEAQTVRVHLQYLKDLHAEGKIVYAGFRKDGVDGIVVFEIASREEAVKLVENDPAVKSRIFAWELHEFHTVLQRGVKP